MALARGIRPVDYLLIVFNTGFGLLWLTALWRSPVAPWLVAAHAAAISLSILTGRLGDEGTPFGRALRDLYPIVLIALYWLEMGLIRHTFHESSFDAPIAAADIWLFGQHLQEVWAPAMPQLWFSEFMFAAYWVYYPMVFLTPLVLVLRGHSQTQRFIFATTVAYLACYTLYAILPVDGPSHTVQRFQGPHTEGFFYQLVMSGTHAADSMGTAFPSSHVVGAVTAALLAVAWFSRPWAVLFILGALGVTLSTVYTQGHFAIDSVIGVVFAVAVYFGATPLLERLFRDRPFVEPAAPPESPAPAPSRETAR
ncbi:MAG: phosphatase PAP2 family protein [Gemmatimonadota bacterium]|nr:MAG: phosphatase PAP2 family protein [Gemmatimonadota bacterium]